MNPTWEYEMNFWMSGLVVAGADEVGRGALAGPVVAAAVIFTENIKPQITSNKKLIIRDSKKMTRLQREKSAKWIMGNTHAYGIGKASVVEINTKGVVRATHTAFRRALSQVHIQIGRPVDHLLVDAFYVPRVRGLPKGRQTPIVKGDSLSVSIAAASIVAKVHRDGLMTKLARKHPLYHWQKNVGYGTTEHRQAILRHGALSQHRKTFCQKS